MFKDKCSSSNGISNSIQLRGMYIILIISFPKDYVHNNVRKWPNLCSIRPQIVLKLVEKFRPIDQFLKHSQLKGTVTCNGDHEGLALCVNNTQN